MSPSNPYTSDRSLLFSKNNKMKASLSTSSASTPSLSLSSLSVSSEKSLSRSLQNMRTSLSLSENSIQNLQNNKDSIDTALNSLNLSHSNTKQAKKLLERKKARERTDQFLLMIGVSFYLLVVVYIVQKRMSTYFPFLSLSNSISSLSALSQYISSLSTSLLTYE
jgi:N-acetylmuramoyl-L-alanine amidase CwlA